MAGRIVDGFFERRCTRLTDTLTFVAVGLKSYRDQIAERDAKRHKEARRESEAEAQRAAGKKRNIALRPTYWPRKRGLRWSGSTGCWLRRRRPAPSGEGAGEGLSSAAEFRRRDLYPHRRRRRRH
jgi:hypothetical protein